PVALADFINWNDGRMIQTGSGFGLATKTFQVRFRGPLAQADHFECDGTVEAFLSRAVNYALTAPADFLQHFVINKICDHPPGFRGAPFASEFGVGRWALSVGRLQFLH